MELLRTGLLLETSASHIAGLSSGDPNSSLISSYLAQTAAVTFYSEVEEKVKEIIAERMRVTGDHRLSHFLLKTNEGVLGRITKSDLVKTVLLFGEDCKEEFNREIEERDVTKYSNVIASRHTISHGSGSGVTIQEVGEAKRVAERMLSCVQRVIV